jgi:hypothetical protein
MKMEEVKSYDAVLTEATLASMFSAPWVKLEAPVLDVYFYVILSSGSDREQSRDAAHIVSIASPGNIILGHQWYVGALTKERNDFLVGFMRSVMSHQMTETAKVVLGVEAGTGYDANEFVSRAREEFGESMMVKSDFETKTGVVSSKDHAMKGLRIVCKLYQDAGTGAPTGKGLFWEKLVEPRATLTLMNKFREELTKVQQWGRIENSAMAYLMAQAMTCMEVQAFDNEEPKLASLSIKE